MKPKLKLTTTEFIQKSYNGGSPLDNEYASDLKIGHGTPLILMPKRQFVALLKRAQLAAMTGPDLQLASEVEDLLKEHDQFIEKVEIKELYEGRDESQE